MRPFEDAVFLDALLGRNHDAEVRPGAHRIIGLTRFRHADAKRRRADVRAPGHHQRSRSQPGFESRLSRDLADDLVRAVDARVFFEGDADRIGQLLVPSLLLIFVGVEQPGVAGAYRKGARQPHGAVTGGRQEFVDGAEDMRLVLLDPQCFRLNEPGSDPVSVVAVDGLLANDAANVVAFGFGPRIHPNHGGAQYVAVLADRQSYAHKTRDTNRRHIVSIGPLSQAILNRKHDGAPISVWILLGPARLWMRQRMLARAGGENPSRARVQHDRLDVGGSDVDADGQLSGHLSPSTVLVG